jgi:hypothetical protein
MGHLGVPVAALVVAFILLSGPAIGVGPSGGTPASAAPVVPADPGRVPGVSANFNSGFGDRANRLAALGRMSAIGVGVDRIDANWIDIEKTAGVYDWSSLDYRVQEVNAAGLTPRVILAYGNPLHSQKGAVAAATLGRGFGGLPPFGIGSPAYFPPDNNPIDLGAFARWAAAVAARYRDGSHGHAHLFEVWNEENDGYRFWEPREDPAWYGNLLAATYDAVKQAAPQDTVAFGGTFYPAVDAHALGLMGVPTSVIDTLALPGRGTLDFIDQALAARPDLGRHFDAMAYHPYHFPYYGPEVNIPLEGTTEQSMTEVRALLDRHGLKSKPIWITEVGWPNNTCAYGVAPAKSAAYLVRTFALAWAHGINQVDWYTYGDGGDPTQNCVNQEAAFGVFDSAGRAKPAYVAWATLNRFVLPLSYSRDVTALLGMPPGGRALEFAGARGSVTVVWLSPESLASDTGALPTADQRARLQVPEGVMQVFDMSGMQLPMGTTFEASPYPVYLVAPAAASPPGGSPGGLPNTSN